MTKTQKINTSSSIVSLKNTLEKNLKAVDKEIIHRLDKSIPMINDIGQHLIKASGKRIRPLLTLAFAAQLNDFSRKPIVLAAAVEFIHTATLLHDDVVDESDLRRGKKTANIIWGNEFSVLAGDFLFAQSFELMVETGSLQVLDILANASATIAEGEVLQLTAAQDVTTTEDIYLQVVRGKTAALFSAATQVGGVISNATDAQCDALYAYGDALGVAFQIVDDLLDVVGDAKSIGKNVGDDFRERKLTLPLIKTIAAADDHEMVFWKRTIEKGDQVDGDLEHAIHLMHKHGAIDATRKDALAWAQIAQDALKTLPQNQINTLLSGIARYVVDRIV